MEYFTQFEYIGLFLSSFLAATLLPLSSEVVLSLLLLKGLNPTTLVAIATLGNVLGSFTNYGVGLWGGSALVRKLFRTTPTEMQRAEQRFYRYGVLALLFAWVPAIGDPLTVVAGFLRVNLVWFCLLVTAGKLGRYLVVSYMVL
ncbi:YqaA family protein [Dongshaea marina]|uniref:YqaA family protein n=1 Tax=Dongshaea marina TaxID=2047966 RepID=UPI000D3E03D1|nr:YqaA family protein [Dongshaea marina]